jgi:hypothetical protein
MLKQLIWIKLAAEQEEGWRIGRLRICTKINLTGPRGAQS